MGWTVILVVWQKCPSGVGSHAGCNGSQLHTFWRQPPSTNADWIESTSIWESSLWEFPCLRSWIPILKGVLHIQRAAWVLGSCSWLLDSLFVIMKTISRLQQNYSNKHAHYVFWLWDGLTLFFQFTLMQFLPVSQWHCHPRLNWPHQRCTQKFQPFQ